MLTIHFKNGGYVEIENFKYASYINHSTVNNLTFDNFGEFILEGNVTYNFFGEKVVSVNGDDISYLEFS